MCTYYHSCLSQQLSCQSAPPVGEDGDLRENKVRSMATQLLAKFEENSSTGKIRGKVRQDFILLYMALFLCFSQIKSFKEHLHFRFEFPLS